MMDNKENTINDRLLKRHNEFEKELLPNIKKNNINLNIGVTNLCNCDCIFCFSKLMKQKKEMIEPELVKRLLEEGAEMGITEFNPYGNYGDPFMCPDIYEYVSYAKKLGYQYIFTNTNGILLTPLNAKKAIECGFDSIRISINAGSKKTYSKVHGVPEQYFDLVIDNVKYLDKVRKEAGSKMILSVSFVEFDKNKEEKELLRAMVKDYIDDFVVFPLMNPRYAFDDLSLLDETKSLCGCAKKSENGCNRIFNSIYINQAGYMTVCALDEGGFGVVECMKDKSLKEVWYGDRFQKIRQMHINNQLEGTVCGNCLNCKLGEMHGFYPEFQALEGESIYHRKEEIDKRFG